MKMPPTFELVSFLAAQHGIRVLQVNSFQVAFIHRGDVLAHMTRACGKWTTAAFTRSGKCTHQDDTHRPKHIAAWWCLQKALEHRERIDGFDICERWGGTYSGAEEE